MLLKKIFINICSRIVVNILGSIVVSIPACHAGDRGSIPRRGVWATIFFFSFYCFCKDSMYSTKTVTCTAVSD